MESSMRFISSALVVLLISSIASAGETVALRVRFGMKDNDGRDWSGKLTPSKGDVKSMRGWRWMQGDKFEGNNAFTVATRRTQPQTRADRLRMQAGGKMPIQDNGFIALLSGVDADTEISFETEPARIK